MPALLRRQIQAEALYAFGKGYGALVRGMSYHDLTQATSPAFDDPGERDLFKKMIERHMDPAPKYQDCRQLRLVVDEGGDKTAAIPRALVTVLRALWPGGAESTGFGTVFLFDLPEGIKARDVTSQLIPILLTTGLLDQDGEKVVRTSPHRLETLIKGAKDWMDGAFETGANAIKKIHHDAGHELFEIQAKDARYRLKEAEKKLQSLSLDFIDKPWDELNKEDAAGNLVYDLRLREALKSVGEVRNGVEWVYDPERIRAFRYARTACRNLKPRGVPPIIRCGSGWRSSRVSTGP